MRGECSECVESMRKFACYCRHDGFFRVMCRSGHCLSVLEIEIEVAMGTSLNRHQPESQHPVSMSDEGGRVGREKSFIIDLFLHGGNLAGASNCPNPMYDLDRYSHFTLQGVESFQDHIHLGSPSSMLSESLASNFLSSGAYLRSTRAILTPISRRPVIMNPNT